MFYELGSSLVTITFWWCQKRKIAVELMGRVKGQFKGNIGFSNK